MPLTPKRGAVLLGALTKAGRQACIAETDLAWATHTRDQSAKQRARDQALARYERILRQAQTEAFIGPPGVRRLAAVATDAMTIARWQIDPALRTAMGFWPQVDALTDALRAVWKSAVREKRVQAWLHPLPSILGLGEQRA